MEEFRIDEKILRKNPEIAKVLDMEARMSQECVAAQSAVAKVRKEREDAKARLQSAHGQTAALLERFCLGRISEGQYEEEILQVATQKIIDELVSRAAEGLEARLRDYRDRLKMMTSPARPILAKVSNLEAAVDKFRKTGAEYDWRRVVSFVTGLGFSLEDLGLQEQPTEPEAA